MKYNHHRNYKTCTDCGANLDPGEACDCKRKTYSCLDCTYLDGSWCLQKFRLLKQQNIDKQYTFMRDCFHPLSVQKGEK